MVYAVLQESVYGYTRLQLPTTGDGEFELVAEVKESEYVTPHDEVLGTLTVSFTVTPNFALGLTKLENQYDTKNLPALMNIVSQVVQYPCLSCVQTEILLSAGTSLVSVIIKLLS